MWTETVTVEVALRILLNVVGHLLAVCTCMFRFNLSDDVLLTIAHLSSSCRCSFKLTPIILCENNIHELSLGILLFQVKPKAQQKAYPKYRIN